MHRAGEGRRAAWVVVAVVVSAALLAAGCGKSDDSGGGGGGQAGSPSDTAGSAHDVSNVTVAPSGAPKAGGKVVYALEAETDGFNPTANRWAASGTVVALAVFDALAAYDEQLKPQPYLAESITPNEQYTSWTIKLRSGIKFHDGEALDAAALKKSIDAFKKSPLTGSAAEPIKDDGVSTPDGPSGLTVKIDMKVPWVAFPAYLTAQGGVVPAPKMLDDPEGAKKPIGTGPFMFQEWTPGQKLVVNKNPSYWRKGLPYLDSVEFRPTPDQNSRYNGIQSRDFDMLQTSDSQQVRQLAQLAADGKIQTWRSVGETEETLVIVNTTTPPLDDVRVRRALAYSMDLKGLAAVRDIPEEDLADGWMSKDSPWYTATDYPTYDLNKAKELIAAYQKDHPGPVSFTLGTTTDVSVVQVGQFLQQGWAQAGIDVKIASFEQAPFIQNALVGQYQAQLWRQFGAPDPDGDYLWFYGGNAKPNGQLSLNMARNKDTELDAALDKGRQSPDQQTRKDAYATVQRRFAADIPYLWISHVRWTIAALPDVRGVAAQTLPDGKPSAGVISGVHRMTEVWRDR